MKMTVKTGLILLLGLAMLVPYADMSASSQYHGYRGGTNTTNNGNRPSRPDNGNNGNRPSRPNNGNNGNRPSRPDNGNNGNRPSRPNNGNNRPFRPHPSRPDRPGNHRPNYHSGHGGHGMFRPVPPPRRPYRPRYFPCSRPVPPPHFRPYVHAPVLTTVFGLPFGISFHLSIDRLGRSGYYIDGYNDREVYLRNVYEMGYSWDDAILRYDRGQMESASMYFSTYNYDLTRYDRLYSNLCALYGPPALAGAGRLTATWYDRHGRNYVTLSYDLMSAFGGSSRYYTILTYGN